MKKVLLTLTLLLTPAATTAFAQESTSTTTTTTETTQTDPNVHNDAVTTTAENDGIPGNEKEPASFPWGLLGLLGLGGLLGRNNRPTPVVHHTTEHVVTGTPRNDVNRR